MTHARIRTQRIDFEDPLTGEMMSRWHGHATMTDDWSEYRILGYYPGASYTSRDAAYSAAYETALEIMRNSEARRQ